MFMAVLTLLVALAISGVAAWYSIVGLMAIFAAAAIPIANTEYCVRLSMHQQSEQTNPAQQLFY